MSGPGSDARETGGSAGPPPAVVVALVTAAAALALAGLSALLRQGTAAAGERDAVAAANDLPAAVGAPLLVVMQLGRRGPVPVITLGVLAAATRRAGLCLAVLTAGLVAGFGADALKEWAGRPRPSGVEVHEVADGFGYPSGHTAIACALAVVVATHLPARRRWLVGALAVAVGIGRIHAGVHYPLDVVGGVAGGVAVGGAVVLVAGHAGRLPQRMGPPATGGTSRE